MERVESVQAYFAGLKPVSVELSTTAVVAMGLRDLAAAIEAHGYADDGIQAGRAAAEAAEEDL